MKNKIMQAELSDGTEMLNLIESDSAKGNIELIYTRRPNACLSYQKEGEAKIGLVKDDEGSILLQIACVVKSYYINGQARRVGYVGGIRKKKDYKGILNWKDITDFVTQTKCDMFYCSFLEDNKAALDIFSKKRKYIPEILPVCEYTTYIINPDAIKRPIDRTNVKYNINSKDNISSKEKDYIFRQIRESDLKDVYKFLNEEGQKYNFAPIAEDLFKQFHGLSIRDCYILEDKSRILAFGALWDQRDYKQYIVTRYTGYMKFFKKFSKFTEIMGYIPIPKENEILNFPTLTMFYSKDNNSHYYNLFLYEIAKEIRKNYKMFIIGMTASHPNDCIYKKIRSIKFKSSIYYANNDMEIILDHNKPVHIECGLL